MRTRTLLGVRASNLELVFCLGISGLLRNYLELIECPLIPVTPVSHRHCEKRDFRSSEKDRTIIIHCGDLTI
jgi:hypothetical protein